MTRYFLLFFIILHVLSCTQQGKKIKDKPISSYQVLDMRPKKVVIYNEFPATVQGENVVEIKPMVSGYLQDIYVQEGSNVVKGQLLFRIKNPQYDQDIITARAAIKIAEANVNTARMNVEKVKPLVQQDIVSKYELDAAQYSLQSQQASLAQAEANLANAQTNQDYTYIRSPQNGTIGLIPFKIGALISNTSSDPLTTLSSTNNVFAYFSVSEKQLLYFMENTNGRTLADKLVHIPPVSLILANGTIYPIKGKLEPASGGVETTTGTATFKATFENTLGLIANGASATVRVPKTLDSALLVPQTAIYQLQDKSFVYKINKDNMVFSTAVTTSPTSDGNFVVITNGIKQGDRLLLNGLNISDSTTIRPLVINGDSIYRMMKTTNP